MPSLIERALQLAASGVPRSVAEVRTALKKEGYVQIDYHLSGASIRNQLRRTISKSAV